MKRWKILGLLTVWPFLQAHADDATSVNAQLSAARVKLSQLQAQMQSLMLDFETVKSQHDGLQQKYQNDSNAYNSNCAGRPVNFGNCYSWRTQVLSEQQNLGSQVLQLEQRAHADEVQAQDLQAQYNSTLAQIQTLQQQQAAFMQLRNAASSSVGAAHTLATNPNAIESAKDQSNCQFDKRGCATPMVPPTVHAPAAEEVVSEAVARDPEYRKLHAERLAAQRRAASSQQLIDKLTAEQSSEQDSLKRQQLQIRIADATNKLETARSTIRVADIGIATVKKRIEGSPDMLPANPGASVHRK